MAHVHVHSSDHPPASRTARRNLILLLVPFAVATLVGLALLWPSEVRPDLRAELGAADALYDARVVDLDRGPCFGVPEEAGIECIVPVVRLLAGPDEGALVELESQSELNAPPIDVGDTIIVSYTADAPPQFQYAFSDLERRSPLLILAVLFALAVIGLGRFQGLRALLGLGLSLAVLIVFVLPAVLEGSDPLAVALVGSALIAFVSLYLAHGFNARTTTALLGSLLSLALVGVLSAVFVGATRLTGLADENALFLTISAQEINLQGLLLGGFVIGALGVLDDVTVTQASAVWELRRANPAYTRWDLYRSAVRIGRDHIAATVNTLVLAYAGASLPLFLLFVQADLGLASAVNGEIVATEIVRTLCGSIGLVASVPLTTGLAALVIVPGRAEGGRGDGETAGGDPEPPATAAEVPGPHGPEGGDGGDGGRPKLESRIPSRRSDPRRFQSRREKRFWKDA